MTALASRTVSRLDYNREQDGRPSYDSDHDLNFTSWGFNENLHQRELAASAEGMGDLFNNSNMEYHWGTQQLVGCTLGCYAAVWIDITYRSFSRSTGGGGPGQMSPPTIGPQIWGKITPRSMAEVHSFRPEPFRFEKHTHRPRY